MHIVLVHPATRQGLEDFTRVVDWLRPHPLHRRKFQKFVIEAFDRGDAQMELEEFTLAIRKTATRSPSAHSLDRWFREYERGIELLGVDRSR